MSIDLFPFAVMLETWPNFSKVIFWLESIKYLLPVLLYHMVEIKNLFHIITGWLFTVKLSQPEELEALMTESAYKKYCETLEWCWTIVETMLCTDLRGNTVLYTLLLIEYFYEPLLDYICTFRIMMYFSSNISFPWTVTGLFMILFIMYLSYI